MNRAIYHSRLTNKNCCMCMPYTLLCAGLRSIADILLPGLKLSKVSLFDDDENKYKNIKRALTIVQSTAGKFQQLPISRAFYVRRRQCHMAAMLVHSRSFGKLKTLDRAKNAKNRTRNMCYKAFTKGGGGGQRCSVSAYIPTRTYTDKNRVVYS